jgi:sugar lactone lactonase YvrE
MMLGAAIVGCQGAPTTVPTPKPNVKRGTPAPVATASPGTPSSVPLSNINSSLSGLAQAPASLVSNNGSNVITNGGAQFRVLAAVAQVPVANAKVTLLDANLSPVKVDGKALETLTDAQGRYGFTTALPDSNLLVSIALPGDKGTLQAIAPKGTTARQVDADLVSTLTTAYILDRYVKGQTDPVATLNKLPADVEAETRKKAGAALSGGTAAVPTALTSATAVATVETLRAQDPAFNAQMETVKQLLVAAGQSDFGSGKKATEVGLTKLRDVVPMPDGTFLISCRPDSRIWKYTADGTLVTALGSGTHKEGTLAGQTGPEAGLRYPISVKADSSGRILVLDHPYDPAGRTLPKLYRLSRLEKDGKLVDLWPGMPAALAAWPAEGDEVTVLAMGDIEAADPARLWAVAPTKEPRLLHTFTAEETAYLSPKRSDNQYIDYGPNRISGKDATGAFYIGVPGDRGRVHRIAPTTYEVQVDYATGGVNAEDVEAVSTVDTVTVDGAGNVITVVVEGETRKLMLKKPDGQASTLIPSLPTDFKMLPNAGCMVLGDGTAYVTQRDNLLYRIKDGQLTLAAGRLDPLTGSAKDIAISSPAGMAINKAGELFLADKFGYRVVKVGLDQKVTLVAGNGTNKTLGDNGPATAASLTATRILRFDAQENLFVVTSSQRVRRVDQATGVITSAYVGSSDYHIRDFVIGPDGAFYFSRRGFENKTDGHINVIRVKDGVETVLVPNTPSPDGANGFVLAMSPAGVLYVLARQDNTRKLYKWVDEQLQLVKEDARFNVSMPNDSNSMAIDAKGRMALTLIDADQVLLYDPAADTVKVLAGPEGAYFKGSGVDDGLRGPRYATFDAEGNLYFDDYYHRQVKRIAATDVR